MSDMEDQSQRILGLELFVTKPLDPKGKLLDVVLKFREAGHTILAVSHSADMLLKLCSRGLWFEHGKLQMDGPISDVIQAYARTLNSANPS